MTSESSTMKWCTKGKAVALKCLKKRLLEKVDAINEGGRIRNSGDAQASSGRCCSLLVYASAPQPHRSRSTQSRSLTRVTQMSQSSLGSEP